MREVDPNDHENNDRHASLHDMSFNLNLIITINF
jgi:hypothetical protein